VVFTALNYFIKSYFFPSDPSPGRIRPPRRLFVYIDAISLFVPLVFSIALKISQRWVKEQAERKEIETAKLESELQSLKYQLQPHFFFNSLNTIYSLVDISPGQAKETIHSLSKMMRYLLYETNTGKVGLKSEVEFVQKYIDLMKLRTSSKTKVITVFPSVPDTVLIPPLLLITLVENAFKHGISATQPTEIYIELMVNENAVIFKTKNQAITNTESDKSMSGIGLVNLRKRLELIYPGKHSLMYGTVEGYFVATLTIALK
jgi:LytS/YehU family sensor histidine kinase